MGQYNEFLCEDNTQQSFHLFREPSFFNGFVSLLYFGNLINAYNTDETGEVADGNAIRSDWKAVGRDIKEAISDYERSVPTHS
jgi:hypothetical protein